MKMEMREHDDGGNDIIDGRVADDRRKYYARACVSELPRDIVPRDVVAVRLCPRTVIGASTTTASAAAARRLPDVPHPRVTRRRGFQRTFSFLPR